MPQTSRTIYVTQEHIDLFGRAAVAQTLKDVTGQTIDVDGHRMFDRVNGVWYQLAEENKIKRFLKSWDLGCQVMPFSFELYS